MIKYWKTSYSFNDYKWRKITLCCYKKISALSRELSSKSNDNFYGLNYVIRLEQKTKLNRLKVYVKIKIFVM